MTLSVATEYARHRMVLASLPATFRFSEEGATDVVVVSGAWRDWVGSAEHLARAGTRGVLVARPQPADPSAVQHLAEVAASSGTLVAVESPAHDSAWVKAVPELRAAASEAVLLHGVVALDGPLSASVVAQIALVRALAPDVARIAGGGNDSGYWIAAKSGGAAVSLSGVVCLAASGEISLDVVGPTEHWQVRFDERATAAPTRIARYHRGGGEVMPAVYERADRAVWRHLAAALEADEPMPYTLADLVQDLDVARRICTATGDSQ